ITHPRPRRRGAEPLVATPAGPPPSAVAVGARPVEVVAVGASTGGPGAVVEVLRGLPPRLEVPVVVVVHISEPFGVGLAEWLGGQTGRPVLLARDGQRLADEAGGVVMAPPGAHLELRGQRLRLTGGPERHSCRPSIDVLFESLAVELG